jgi:predicted PurR-regulated permease PerM
MARIAIAPESPPAAPEGRRRRDTGAARPALRSISDSPEPGAGRLAAEAPRVPWERRGSSVLRLSLRGKAITATVCVGLLVLLLWAARTILTPFIVALILAYVLNPFVARICQRAHLPRAVAVAGIYVVIAMLLTWGALVVFPLASREARELAATLPRLLVHIRNTLAQEQVMLIFGVEVSLAPISDELTRTLGGLVTTASHRLVETAVNTVETLFKLILALVATFYLLMSVDRMKRTVAESVPPRVRQEFGPVVAEIDRILGRYMRGQILLILIMSSATWLVLSVLGIRYALILGLITGVLELIPVIGPITAAVPAVAVALFQESPFGWTPLVNAGVVALAYFLLRHAEDYFVIPQVVGRVVELHPLFAMFAIFSGAAVGGVLGMFLGVPVAAVVRILGRYVYFKLLEEAEPVTAQDTTHPAGPAETQNVRVPKA